MTLSKRSFIARLAYFPDGPWDMPDYVSLCPLFWRVVFRLGAGLGLGTLVCLLLYKISQNLLEFFTVGGFILLVVGVFIASCYTISRIAYRYDRISRGTLEPSMIDTIIYSIKNRVCPRIKLENES